MKLRCIGGNVSQNVLAVAELSCRMGFQVYISLDVDGVPLLYIRKKPMHPRRRWMR